MTPFPATAVTRTPETSSAWRTLALTSVAVFVVSLDGTVLYVAFPAIRATFSDVCSSAGGFSPRLPASASEPARAPGQVPLLPWFTSAIAEIASSIDKRIEAVSFSPANNHPSSTATIGFTYVCVATNVGG